MLLAAADVFRSRGYEGSSVDDLVEATALHRGSIYGAFGSKRGLFLAAMRRTLALAGAEDADGLGRAAPVEDLLDLALVAALDLAPRDDEVREAVDEVRRLLDRPPGRAAEVLGARLLARAGLLGHPTPAPHEEDLRWLT